MTTITKPNLGKRVLRRIENSLFPQHRMVLCSSIDDFYHHQSAVKTGDNVRFSTLQYFPGPITNQPNIELAELRDEKQTLLVYVDPHTLNANSQNSYLTGKTTVLEDLGYKYGGDKLENPTLRQESGNRLYLVGFDAPRKSKGSLIPRPCLDLKLIPALVPIPINR